jgi:hypothetical protein
MSAKERVVADSDKGDVVWCEEKEIHICVCSDEVWRWYKGVGEIAIDYWSV